MGVDENTPIRMGEATVLPGDVVFADDEVMICFPPYLVKKVIQEATGETDKKNCERELIQQKSTASEISLL